MRSHTIRFTPTGVEVRSPNKSGGLTVYASAGMRCVGNGKAPGCEPYSTWTSAIAHIARMMGAADRMLAGHPGEATDWLTWDEAVALTRPAAA
jgi:hypothetical protein